MATEDGTSFHYVISFVASKAALSQLCTSSLTTSPFHKMDLNRNQLGDDASLVDIDMDIGPAGKPLNPPRPRIHQQTSPKICVSENATRYACARLATTVFHDDDPDDIRRSLDVVFILVRNLLSEDNQLCGRLASRDEYRNNVEHFGEGNFIQLLRDTAKQKNWQDLFEHGTLHLHLTRPY